MERVRIGKDIVFQWEVRKDGAALTAEDAANLTLEIAGRNGKFQRLPFEIRDSKIIAAWYGVQQTEIGAYRLTCWHNRGKVGESVVDVVWAVELVRYTTEETFDDIETVTIELDGGNLTFAALKGASAYEVAVAEGFVGTEAEWVASLKKPAEDAAEDAEEAAARAIEAAENAGAAATIAETAAQTAENAAGDANTAAGLANSAADNAEAKAQLADAAADNANTAANEAYNKAQEADTAATTATNAAQSANSAAASADEAARGAVEAAVEATQSAENAQTQADNAHSAADYANEMAIAAEKVNAQLNGNILTVTNRQGTSISVNTKGEQGEQGNPGQAATISVGTTTTGAPGTDAQVTNSGTSSAAVLNFTIPKGDKGPQGEPGEVTEAELTEKLAAKANTDGYYSRMIVGGAESVIGKENDLDAATDYVVQGATGIAKINELMGRSERWNQLASFTSESKTQNGITYSLHANGKVKVSGTASAALVLMIQDNLLAGITSHKYFLKTPKKADDNFYIQWLGLGLYPSGGTGIYTCTTPASASGYMYIRAAEGAVIDYEDYIMAIDLTDIYGEGNEPTTVEQFAADVLAKYGKTLDEYFAYDAGSINNANVESLKVYDEGSTLRTTLPINASTITGKVNGEGESVTIFPNGMRGVGSAYDSLIVDEDGWARRAIRRLGTYTFTGQETFVQQSAGVAIYICTNILIGAAGTNAVSLSSKYPFSTSSNKDKTFTIANGTSYQQAVVIKDSSIATVSEAPAACNGMEVVYPLATPIEYVLDTPILMTFNAYNGGVIRQVKGDMELATRMNIAFALNVEGFVNGASKEYINAASMQGFLSVLGTQTGGTWSMTWSEIDKKYIYVFTPNSYTNETYNNN